MQGMDLFQRGFHQKHGEYVVNKIMGNMNHVTSIILKVLVGIASISIVIEKEIQSIY